MPQLSSTLLARRFYKYTFEIRDKGKNVYTHTLLLNPSDMSMDEPPRISAIQTLGGAYVSNFGQGLPSVSISGTTGYNARRKASGDIQDGYTEWKAFRDKVYRYYVKTKSTQLEMFWYNWEDDEYYEVVPTAFRLMRSKSEPNMYRYEFRFICIKKVGDQDASKVVGKSFEEQESLLSILDFGSPLSAISEITEAFKKGGK